MQVSFFKDTQNYLRNIYKNKYHSEGKYKMRRKIYVCGEFMRIRDVITLRNNCGSVKKRYINQISTKKK